MSVIEYLKNTGKVYKKEKNEISVEIEKRDLLKVLKELKRKEVERIVCISGMDTGKDIQVLYHFQYPGGIINLKVSLPKKRPQIKTITDLYPGAILFERELMEMLGVEVKGHPEPKSLFLDKDSPKTPLRKD